MADNRRLVGSPEFVSFCEKIGDASEGGVLAGIVYQCTYYVLGQYCSALNWNSINSVLLSRYPAGLSVIGLVLPGEGGHVAIQRDCRRVVGGTCNEEVVDRLAVVLSSGSGQEIAAYSVDTDSFQIEPMEMKIDSPQEWMTKEVVAVSLKTTFRRVIPSSAIHDAVGRETYTEELLKRAHLLVEVNKKMIISRAVENQEVSVLMTKEQNGSRPSSVVSIPSINELPMALVSSTGIHGNTTPISPLLEYSSDAVEWLTVSLPISVKGVFLRSDKLGHIRDQLLKSCHIQMKMVLETLYSRSGSIEQPVYCSARVYHFPAPFQAVPITVVYPHLTSAGEPVTFEQTESLRKELHELFVLSDGRPYFRPANLHLTTPPSPYLLNPHKGATAPSGPGRVAVVDGWYDYHHYMQDRFDDNGWGCAYRSLQTLWSWFRYQGYTEDPVPSHRDIQQTICTMQKKEQSFVGSKEWIGSIEISDYLNESLGVTCYIMHSIRGAEIASRSRELMEHFDKQGTPVMIGGNALAHTILGVYFSEETGDVRFLVLDPHYTGGEDLKVILNKGWCGWKGVEFWNPQVNYNLCLPRRPEVRY